jgi:hypothetical protein
VAAVAALIIFCSIHQKATAQTVTRDPNAISLLQQCSVATGGANLTVSLRLEGTIAYAAGSDTQQPFVFERQGLAATRFTVSTTSGSVVHVLNGGHAQVTLANGRRVRKPDASVRYAWPQFAPALLCAWPLQAGWFSVQFLGQSAFGASQTDHIKVTAVVAGADGNPDPIETLLSQADIYLDATTHLPLRLTLPAFGTTGIQNSISIDTYYSGYAQYQGISFATQIAEFANGVPNRTVAISSVAVNPSLSPSDFTLGAQ